MDAAAETGSSKAMVSLVEGKECPAPSFPLDSQDAVSSCSSD